MYPSCYGFSRQQIARNVHKTLEVLVPGCLTQKASAVGCEEKKVRGNKRCTKVVMTAMLRWRKKRHNNKLMRKVTGMTSKLAKGKAKKTRGNRTTTAGKGDVGKNGVRAARRRGNIVRVRRHFERHTTCCKQLKTQDNKLKERCDSERSFSLPVAPSAAAGSPFANLEIGILHSRVNCELLLVVCVYGVCDFGGVTLTTGSGMCVQQHVL